MKPFFICFFAGAVMTLALPPLGFWPVIWFSLPVFALRLFQSLTLKQAIINGFGFGLGYFAFGLYWVGHSIIIFNVDLAFLMPFLSLGLALGLALFYGLIGVIMYLLKDRLNRFFVKTDKYFHIFIFVFVIVMSLTDQIRSVIFTGFPWNVTGYLLAGNIYFLQIFSLIGVEGAGIIALLIGLSPLMMIDEKGFKAIDLKKIFFICLMPALLYGYGALRLHNSAIYDPHDDRQIRIVQANIAQTDKWRLEKMMDNIRTYYDMSMNNRPNEVKMIIWPETALTFDIFNDPSSRLQLAKIIPQDGILISGSLRYGGDNAYNSLAVIDDGGGVVAGYDKLHLVPFGEYLPFRGFLQNMGLEKLTQGGDYSPGTIRELVDIDNLPSFIPLICYEIIFSQKIMMGKNRPDFLLNLTNDAWFGQTNGPKQHLAHARTRAVEQGMPLIRSANTGISAVFDGYGRELARLDVNETGVIDIALPPALPTTIYAKAGIFIYYMMIFVLIVIAGLLLYNHKMNLPKKA